MQPRQLVLPELGEPRAPGAAPAIDDASGEFLARYEAERGKEVAASHDPLRGLAATGYREGGPFRSTSSAL